jgi:hypothetical protein
MEEYICTKDFCFEDVIFAKVGDTIVVLPDKKTVVNKATKSVISNPELVKDKRYFSKVPKSDRVNHPSHYTWLKEKCGIEVIDITRHLDFDKGNAVKYLLRSGYKIEEGLSMVNKEIEDLRKAIWYIQDKINELEKYAKYKYQN